MRTARNIYKLIGYSDKRQEKYKNEPAAQTITELDAFAHTVPTGRRTPFGVHQAIVKV